MGDGSRHDRHIDSHVRYRTTLSLIFGVRLGWFVVAGLDLGKMSFYNLFLPVTPPCPRSPSSRA
jgi:hypothetical protein